MSLGPLENWSYRLADQAALDIVISRRSGEDGESFAGLGSKIKERRYENANNSANRPRRVNAHFRVQHNWRVLG
jgi:hypothetical protein